MTPEEKQQVRQRIGQRIKTLREMQGWSITELADRAGLDRAHISRIEAGKYGVSIETLQAIAAAFGMTVDIVPPQLAGLAVTPAGKN